jgi:phosphopantetheinyl transferase
MTDRDDAIEEIEPPVMPRHAGRKPGGSPEGLPHIFVQALNWGEDTELPGCLSAQERERCGRFIRARDRVRYAQSHAFLRETLSRFAAIEPADWRFSYGEFGRPSIAGPAEGLGIEFNLSHTHDWAACVVTRGVRCGIDIERIRPITHMMGIAETRFAPEEFREIEQLDDASRPRRFFELWTEKEAWVKAHGQGITLGLHRAVRDIPGVTLYPCEAPPDHAMAVVLLVTDPEFLRA